MRSRVLSITAVSLFSLGLTTATTFAQSTTAPTEAATNPSSADQKFAKTAMEGGLAEVQLGQLAQQKASADDVKQFGQKMVDDHTRLNDQMKELAPALGVTPPTQLSAKHQALQTKLQGMSGDQFDKAYLKAMVSDHKKDSAEFKKEASTTQNAQLKTVAQQGSTVIDGHLQMVEQLNKNHSGGKGKMKMGL
jgi:putative membrane protein